MAILFYILVLSLSVFVGFGILMSRGLEEKLIEIKTDKTEVEFVILAISDFHSQLGEEDMRFLKNKVKNVSHIALVGDIFDDLYETKAAYEFVEYLYDMDKNIYFVLGNHEARHKDLEEITSFMQKKTQMLDVRNSPVSVGNVRIYGLNDAKINEKDFFESLRHYKENMNKAHYNILLSHRPEYFSFYADAGFDLVLSGHAHGGQIRIPGLGGIFAPGQGFFPKYTKGIYKKGRTQMVLMTGATSKKYLVPRLFNRPDFVKIVLKRGDKDESYTI